MTDSRSRLTTRELERLGQENARLRAALTLARSFIVMEGESHAMTQQDVLKRVNEALR